MYEKKEVRIATVALALAIENAERIAWIDFLRWSESDDPEEPLRIAYARGLAQAAIPPGGKLYDSMLKAISDELGFAVDGGTCYDLASRLLCSAGSSVSLLEGLALSARVHKIMREHDISTLDELSNDELEEIIAPWGETSSCDCHPVALKEDW